MPGIARKALRWGLVGGACCFLSWCGLTAVSAGTAHAATQDSQGHASVTEQQPVERLIGDVGSVARDLTELTGVPADATAGTDAAANTDGASNAASAAVAGLEDRATAKDVDAVADGIDQLTTLATSLDGISIPVNATGGGHSAMSEQATDGDADTHVDVQVLGDSGGTMPSDVSMTGADAQDASTQADGAATHGTGRQHQHTALVPASSSHADGDASIGVGDGGAGDLPVVPLDPRAFTSSTTSSSSAGSSALDGGSGARVSAFHLPYVARSVTVPALAGVELPWNPAGKPRVSPD